MRVRTWWWEKFYRLSLLRAGVKAGHAFLGTLTSSRMNGTRYCPSKGIYGEEAFRYLLESESMRSERSGHLCQILLVYRTDAEKAIAPMGPDLAKTVIAALVRSLRDTDYIGWYREGRVVGGVLTLLGRDSLADGCTRLRTSLVGILQSELGLEESHRVRVRLYKPDEVKELDLL